MSKTIDQRVVEMRFDNKQFESATKTTMSTLDKLKQKLNFTGATKGLDDLSSAAKKVDVSSIGKGVEAVQVKFSALQTVAVTALANITNSAVNAGKQIVSALTFEPVFTGFQEYETQMNAVQTILANTAHAGTTLEDVTAALDDLNTYADKTIYNFTEMTKNIGTFTAAGVGLEDSAEAIKGIANLAALSGSTSAQASTAMYQLSQALAAGTVNLQDWNSVVNAGMGGKVFQDALVRTAAAMKGVTEETFRAENITTTFRESISTQGGTGWLDAEVLLNTLRQFTGDLSEAELAAMGFTQAQIKNIQDMATNANDAATKVKTLTQLIDTTKEALQSGWAQTWKLIFGDFEEAKEFFTDLSDRISGMVQQSTDARNNLLEGALTSSWSQFEEEINNAGVATEDFQKAITETAKTHHVSIDRMIKEEGSFAKAMESGKISSELVVETLKDMADTTKETGKATSDMSGKLEEFQKVVDQVWNGDFKNGEEQVKALTAAGYDYAQVQDLVNKIVDGQKLKLEDLSDVQLKSVGYTEEQVKAIRELAEQAEKANTPLNDLIERLGKPSGRELLLESVVNVFDSLVAVLGSVKTAWDNTFSLSSEQLYNIIEGIHGLTESLVPTEETVDKLTRTFEGLFAILDIVATITGGALRIGFKALTTILGMADVDILSFTASIGDAVVAFRDWAFENNVVVKGLEKLLDGARTGVETIRNWIDAFMELPQTQAVLEKLGETSSTVFGNLKEYFSEGIERIKEFIDRLKAMDSITLDDIGDIFKDFYENVIEYFANFDGVFDTIKSALTEFKDFTKEKFEDAWNAIQWFWDKCVEFGVFMKELFVDNIGKIMAIGIGVGTLMFVKQLVNILDSISSFGGVGEILEGIGDVLGGYTLKLKSEALMNIAKAIGLLAVSVGALTLLDQGKLWSSVGALAALSAALTLLAGAIALIGKFGDFSGSSLSIAALASSVLILVVALKQMETLNGDLLVRNITTLGIIAAGLATIAGLLGKFAPKLSSGSITLLAFALSLKILVGTLDDLDELNTDGIEKKVFGLLGVMAGLALISTACKGLSIGSAVGVIGVVMALKLLIGSFEDISELDTAKMKESVDTFVTVFGMFALLMASSHLAGKNALKGGGAILMMSAALLVIIQAFKMMSKIDPLDMDRSLEAVTKLLIVFAAIVTLSNFAGQNAAKAGVMLLTMSGAILILTGVIALLSMIEPDGLERGLAAVIALEVVFAAIVALTRFMKSTKGSNKALITLTVTVTLLAAAIAALSMLDPSRLATASASLSAVMAMFSLMVASTSLASKASGTLVIMTGVVAALAGILAVLSGLPVENTLTVAASLSTLMLSLSASMVIISKAGTVAPQAYATIGVLFLTIAGLATIIGVLAALDVGSTLEIAESLSLLLTALSASCLILAAVGKVGAVGALQGALALDGVILIVGGLMAGIGALAVYFPAMEEFVDKGIVLLEKIGYGLGSFFGSIVGGFSAGVTSGLPKIGEQLSEFMANIQPFLDGAKSIDESSMNGVKALAETIVILTGAEILNSIGSWLTGGASLSKFGEDLVPFGQAMAQFSSTIKGKIDSESVTAATNAALTLAELTSKLPKQGGLLQSFLGEQDLGVFSSQLQAFGKAIVDFSTTVKGKIESADVEAAANAGMMLSQLASNLPKQGGWAQTIFGEQDLSVFAKQLKAFGKAIVDFSTTVKGKVDESAVTSAANAGTVMSELASKLPKQEGWAQTIFGEQNLETFGNQLKEFGRAIVDFSGTVKGQIDIAAVEAAANAGTVISELASKLPKQAGWAQAIFGEQDMSVFGTQLVSFGQSFAQYSRDMMSVDSGVVITTSNAADSIVKLATSLPENKLFKNETTLDEFGKQLAKFGESFAKYYNNISEINSTQLSSVIYQMGNLIDMAVRMSEVDSSGMGSFSQNLTKLGQAGINGFISAFTDATPRVTSTAQNMITTFINGVTSQQTAFVLVFVNLISAALTAIKNKFPEFETAGQNAMTKFIAGVRSRDYAVREAFTGSLGGALSAVRDYYDDFYAAGEYLAGGLAAGLEDNVQAAIDSAIDMAQSAANAIDDELQIRSPSRVSRKSGNFFGMGFVLALKDYAGKAYDASEEMATKAKSGLTKAIAGINDFIDSGIDTQPTIRPVLDLTNLESGTRRLNTLFSRNQAMSVNTRMNRMATATFENQNRVTATPAGNTYQFTQNNYSPKALSRVDIYRQTKNQFSAFGRAVKA